MPDLPILLLIAGALITLGVVAYAFSGPSVTKARERRLQAVRERHSGGSGQVAMEAQIRRISNNRSSKADVAAARILPNVEQLRKRLLHTGRNWTISGYGYATLIIAVVVTVLFALIGMPALLALFVGIFAGVGLPHLVVGFLIKKRIGKFTTKFPDAIELLVRGLRSGLPITETMGVVGSEIPGPVGEEFRAVNDRMRIGRTLDAALQETADRIGTPEFQFFLITIAIQRETGGNLAETLANLADVLRKRSQMKLKVAAMSSEAKASAYIIGVLPFAVFGLISWINPEYMAGFFVDQRLMIIGAGGVIWMGIGAFIMAKMINFEI